MAGTRVSVDGLADAVMKGLEEYSKLSTDGMKDAVKKAGKNCKQEISANAPKRTGRYAGSSATKVTGEAANMMPLGRITTPAIVRSAAKKARSALSRMKPDRRWIRARSPLPSAGAVRWRQSHPRNTA